MPTATADTPAARLPAASGSIAARFAAGARQPVSSASTTAFRVAFGLLVTYSTIRFIARRWVETFYLAPAHHLTYPRFEWVRPLPEVLMYLHMGALAALGLAIAVGYRYRLAAGLFAVGFAYTELLDAALYLNHYWFVTLCAVVLAVAPSPAQGSVPAITVWALRGQVAVVYVFAGFAKLNPDWLLEAMPMRIWLAARTDRPLVGPWLDEPVAAYVLSWAGAMFDLTIVGWLLWRRSRPFAYAAVLVFHLVTAALFQIGVFPWVMIALTPIFFGPDWPRMALARLTGSAAPSRIDDREARAPVPRPAAVALALLAAVNIVLPLRHYAADGNVRFNDDGYYLSWRVMLTERTGFVEFEVADPINGTTWTASPELLLDQWQTAQVTSRPDLILATAHLIADDFAHRGHPDVEVRAEAWVSFNGRPRVRWIDPTVDLAAIARTAPANAYVLPSP